MKRMRTLLATGAFFVLLGCQNQNRMEGSLPTRDINEVLTANSGKLMAMPSVAGVYVGLMPDEKTHCIKVMLKRDDSEALKAIPKTLEGYPVLIEVTGEIKPLK